jgi:[ribosomal protein S18]-alanine N-acetyltransferase
MSVTIRPATLDDVPAILAIERQAPSAAHWTTNQYQRLLETVTGTLLIAENEGKLCGFLAAKRTLEEWEIENVVVARGSQRGGVGDELIHALIREAQKNAGSRILLEVRESNLPARSLYEKHGFREVGRRRQYYQRSVEDAVLYDLCLE